MIKLLFACAAIWAAAFGPVGCKSACSFLLYGADEISNGIQYKGGVMWHGCSDGSSVAGVMVQLSHEAGHILAEKEIVVTGGATGYFNYTLNVPNNACVMDGLAGHKTKLNLIDSTMSIDMAGPAFTSDPVDVKCTECSKVFLIQFSKPLYKPGDNLSAQIFCLDREDTGPCNQVAISTSIVTPALTVMNVEEYTFGADAVAGQVLVAEYSFKVSEKPLLGKYCLKLESLVCPTQEECFDIQEYVLPTFETTMEFDQVAVVKGMEGEVTGVLSTEYTYGQVVLSPVYDLTCKLGSAPLPIAEEHKPTKENDWTFKIREEVLSAAIAAHSNEKTITCYVITKEQENSELPTQETSASIPVEQNEIIVECADTFSCPEVVRPGKFNYTLKVRYATGINAGMPLDSSLKLEVKFRECHVEVDQAHILTQSEVIVGDRIQVMFETNERVPDQWGWGCWMYGWEVSNLYATVKKASGDTAVSNTYSQQVDMFSSEMEVFLSVEMCDPTATYVSGSTACLSVNVSPSSSQSSVQSIFSMIKSRGVVRDVDVLSPQSFPHEFQVDITPDMTPNFIVLLSAHVSNSTMTEIIPASITIPVERSVNMFENSVNLSVKDPPAGRDYFEPGENATVKIVTGSADSQVALIGLDTRVIALAGDKNIITLDVFVEAMAEEDKSNNHGDDEYYPIRFFCWFPLPSTSGNARDTIEDAGFVFIESGKVTVPGEKDNYYDWHRGGDLVLFDAVPEAGAGPNEGANIFNDDDFTDDNELEDSENGNTEGNENSPQKVKKRRDFLEVIKFKLLISSNGQMEMEEKVWLGDMTTTHKMYASAISPTKGFATMLDPLEIVVFKKVFSTVYTPYAVIRTESFLASVTVCNYNDNPLSAHIDFTFAAGDFEFIDANATHPMPCSHVIDPVIANKECRLVTCNLNATKIGDPELTVTLTEPPSQQTAESQRETYDIFVKKVKVKAEGCEQKKNYDKIELTAGKTEQCFDLEIPDDSVNNSGIAHVRLFSQLSAPAANNPGNLIRMPTGCGEQTMLTLAPLVYLKQILSATGVAIDEDKDMKLTQYMFDGYQRELRYRNTDGGYTAFGGPESKDPSSTWLSCFVVRTFAEAKNGKYAAVADDDLRMTYKFLLDELRVRDDGLVVENGRVLHSDMQGGSAGPETLASYCLLAVSQAPKNLSDEFTSYQTTRLEKMYTFVTLSLTRAIDGSSQDSYLLALGGVAIYDYMVLMGQDPTQDPLLISIRNRILDLKDEKELECGNIFWTRGVSTSTSEETEESVDCTCKPAERTNYYYYYDEPPPSEMPVESTAYCVAFLSKMETDTTPVDHKLVTQKAVRWLGCEQEPTGGYQHTQDTVSAYYGMSLHTDNQNKTDLTVTVTKKIGEGTLSETIQTVDGPFRMEPSVELFLYEFLDVPKKSVPDNEKMKVCVDVNSAGQGAAYMAAEIYYNVTNCSTPQQNALLRLGYKILEEFADRLSVEFNLTYLGSVNEDSGMGIFEVTPLSGFCPFEELLWEFKENNPNVDEVVVNDKGYVTIYFNKFLSESIVVFHFFKCAQIFGPQPVEAKAQLYYDNSVHARTMWEATALKLGSAANPCGILGCQTNGASGRYMAVNNPLVSILMVIAALVAMTTGFY